MDIRSPSLEQAKFKKYQSYDEQQTEVIDSNELEIQLAIEGDKYCS